MFYFYFQNCNSNKGVKLSPEDLKVLYEFRKTCDTAMNTIPKETLPSLSSELQLTLKDILNFNITINFTDQNNSSSPCEYAFLCKSCGTIS